MRGGGGKVAAFNRITNVKLLCQLASLFKVMYVCVCVRVCDPDNERALLGIHLI